MSACYDENGEMIPYDMIEVQEQMDCMAFIRKDDCVLELGARWGGVSITINHILEDKTKQLVVEPDSRVWEALEKNRDNHGCKFEIVKGAISNEEICLDTSDKRWAGLATFTTPKKDSLEVDTVPKYSLKDYDYNFNVLVVDCEGFFETFYNENRKVFKGLRLILLEKDRPDFCDYERLDKEFDKLGFTKYKDNGEHAVYLKL